jgi:hypothetical protein
MSNKRYKLKKDLPDCKAGTILEQDKPDGLYMYVGETDGGDADSWYVKEVVETNQDWFELIEDKEWEIISFCTSVNKEKYELKDIYTKDEKGFYREWETGFGWTLDSLLNKSNAKIYRVKRLSDSETFVVGDEISAKHISRTTIKSFNVVKGQMKVECENDYCDIYWISKLPKPQPTQEVFTDREPFDKFEVGVESLINKLSLENASDTPDYISAEFLRKVFELFNSAIKQRTKWYGVPNDSPQASKTNTVKEERYFDCERDKGVKFFEDEAPKFQSPQPNKERIEVMNLVEIETEMPFPAVDWEVGKSMKTFSNQYLLFSSKPISQEKYPLIKQAIEYILNDDAKSYWEMVDKFSKPPNENKKD